MPRRNERDLEDIPEELRRELTMHFVHTVDEVLGYALRNGDEPDQIEDRGPSAPCSTIRMFTNGRAAEKSASSFFGGHPLHDRAVNRRTLIERICSEMRLLYRLIASRAVSLLRAHPSGETAGGRPRSHGVASEPGTPGPWPVIISARVSWLQHAIEVSELRRSRIRAMRCSHRITRAHAESSRVVLFAPEAVSQIRPSGAIRPTPIALKTSEAHRCAQQ